MTDEPQRPGDDDRPDYGLATDEGNDRLNRVLGEVAAQIERGELERAEAVVLLSDGLQAIGESNPEATDTTVRTAVVSELDPVFTAAGWERLTPFEF